MKIMDRRRGRRFDVKWPVYVSHSKCGIVLAKVSDVSVSGVSVITPLRFPVKDSVNLAIDVTPTVTIKCVGQIMREKSSSNGRFCYGIRLLRISNADYKTYTDVLLGLLRKSSEEANASPDSDRNMRSL